MNTHLGPTVGPNPEKDLSPAILGSAEILRGMRGAGGRDRTDGLLITNQLLYH